jgi:hypothetical protein
MVALAVGMPRGATVQLSYPHTLYFFTDGKVFVVSRTIQLEETLSKAFYNIVIKMCGRFRSRQAGNDRNLTVKDAICSHVQEN